MGSEQYAGTSGPPSGTFTGVISWATDSSVVNSGWKLCQGSSPGPEPTPAPTTPTPTTAAPAPPPAGPGLCCYGGCGGGNCQGGWCGESQGNCEGNCNGEFCPAAGLASL